MGTRDEMQIKCLARSQKTLERIGRDDEPVVETLLAQFDSAMILV